MNNKKERIISGPTYILRLEGIIGTTKKVVYLFGEIHDPEEKCKNVNSENIKNYFARTLKTKKNIDFFLEQQTNPNISHDYTDYNQSATRIFHLRKFLTYHSQKKDYTNVRYHVFDIRDMFITTNDYTHLLEIFENKMEYEQPYKFDYLTDKDNKSLKKLLGHIVYKLYNKYLHSEVKSIINDYMNLIHDYLRGCRSLEKNKADDQIYTKFGPIVYDHLINYWEVMNIFVLLIDLYALSRFLDKDYITTAIFYTGHRHTANYLDILIKHFGFIVTHISNEPDVTKVDNINQLIKNNNIEYYQLYFNVDPISQCCDISHFPEDYN